MRMAASCFIFRLILAATTTVPKILAYHYSYHPTISSSYLIRQQQQYNSRRRTLIFHSSFSSTSTTLQLHGMKEEEEEQQQQQHLEQEEKKKHWTVCLSCNGEGKIKRIPSKKARLRYKLAKKTNAAAIAAITGGGGDDNENNIPPQPLLLPPKRIDPCPKCNQTGLISTPTKNQKLPPSNTNNNYPSVAIIGGGLGGLALAIACQHRQIPYKVYERDMTFSQRKQGYGLTMQQASRALKSFGIFDLPEGITSTRHVVHNINGTILGEWGLRKWITNVAGRDNNNNSNKNNNKNNKRQNIHIARQALRQELLDQVDPNNVLWGHKLVNIVQEEKEDEDGSGSGSGCSDNSKTTTTMRLEFLTTNQTTDDDNDNDTSSNTTVTTTTTTTHKANIVVGADGIRSTVRQYVVDDNQTPLRYLNCLVVLGICPLNLLPSNILKTCDLLDGETVFQTADGSTRIYCMPFSTQEYMWQLSFPMDEKQAKLTSNQGPIQLKEQALKMCHQWHSPIIEILQQTPIELISGYPVYDRDLLTLDMLNGQHQPIVLIGDAAHPMSPFKGQGANQAILDSISLARSIYENCCRCSAAAASDTTTNDDSSTNNNIQNAIDKYNSEMVLRSAKKVQASASAAQFLHTDIAIQKGDITRGAAAAAAAAAATATATTEATTAAADESVSAVPSSEESSSTTTTTK